MSKIVIEQIVCDEHEEDHEAPYYALVKLINRKTGIVMGTYGIDVCKDVLDWYASNGTNIVKHQPQRIPRKRKARNMVSAGASKAQVGSKNPTSGMIRAWAKSQGLSVSQRGRISKEVTTAYRKAH